MRVKIFDTDRGMGGVAAKKVGRELRRCINAEGGATFLAATGTSQVRCLEALTQERGVG